MARERFERALAIDGTFAEAHGSMAVILALEGHKSAARQSAEIARRLDPQSPTAQFALRLVEGE